MSLKLGTTSIPGVCIGGEVSPTLITKTITANGTYDATDDSADGYSEVTVSVSSGKPAVIFIDYDGTILHEYTATELASLSDLPSNPTHTGLISQGWNWTLAEINAQLTAMPNQCVYVGQLYITESGATEIDCTFVDGALSPCIILLVTGTVYIDWGDSQTSTVTGTNNTVVSTQHTYASIGDYCISISAESGSSYYLGGGNSSKPVIAYTTDMSTITNTNNAAYRSAIKAVRCASDTKTNSYAFYMCYRLETIAVSPSLNNTGSLCSYCYTLKSFTYPRGVTQTGGSIFQECYCLDYVSLSPSITQIRDYCFRDSTLKDITIPKDVTRIDQYAFNSTQIEMLYLPPSLTTQGSNIASGCRWLKKAILSTVTPGDNGVSSCSQLTDITIPSGRTKIGNYEFGYNLSKTISLPNTITNIGTYAFQYCYAMQSINLPSAVTVIGQSAFRGCKALERITIPSGVSIINNNTFYECYSLRDVDIPSTVTSIGSNVFYSCLSLATITIPSSVTAIGTGTFGNCYGLSEIHLKPTSPPTLGSSSVFTNVPSTCVFYVPSASLEDYKTASNWSAYASHMVGE